MWGNAEEIYHRQYEALVVVGVLADEINASRRVYANGGPLVEFLGEGLQRLRLDAIDVGERCRHGEISSGLFALEKHARTYGGND